MCHKVNNLDAIKARRDDVMERGISRAIDLASRIITSDVEYLIAEVERQRRRNREANAALRACLAGSSPKERVSDEEAWAYYEDPANRKPATGAKAHRPPRPKEDTSHKGPGGVAEPLSPSNGRGSDSASHSVAPAPPEKPLRGADVELY